MATLDFDLYRIHVRRRPGQLFDEDPPPSATVLREYAVRPLTQTTSKSEWHTGNISQIDDLAYYLRIGRTTKTTSSRYLGGNFVEVPDEDAVFSHAILDTDVGFLAISRNAKVAGSTGTSARKFARMMEREDDFPVGLDVEVDPVKDPSDFLEILQSAHAVKSFRFTISPPNHFEPNEIINATQKAVQEIEGKRASVQIEGERLDPEELAPLTQALAGAGEYVSASVQDNPHAKPIRRYLGQNQVTSGWEGEITEAHAQDQLLAHFRLLMNNMRAL